MDPVSRLFRISSQEGVWILTSYLRRMRTNKTKNKLIDTEDKLMVTRWEGAGGLGGKGERDQEVQTASYKTRRGDVKYSTGDIVSNIVNNHARSQRDTRLTGWSPRNLYKCLITMLYT